MGCGFRSLSQSVSQSYSYILPTTTYLQVGQAADEVLTHQLIDFLMGEADGIPKVNWPWTWTFALTVRTEPQVTKGRARPPPAAAKSLTAPAIFSLAPFGGRTKKKELLWPVFLTGPFHSIPFHCYIAKYNFHSCISGSKIPLPSLYGVKTIPWGSAHSDHHCAGRSERWELQKCTWCSIQHVQGLVKLELFSKFFLLRGLWE